MTLRRSSHRIEAWLAEHRIGRMLMHLAAMAGDHEVRWHLAGIGRELA